MNSSTYLFLFEAPYCDPQSKLYYHNVDEYQTVKNLPSDITAGYLALRGSTSVV